MVIKTDKSWLYLIFVEFLLSLSISILFLALGGLIPAGILFVFTLVLSASGFVTIGRTIVMTETGCTLTFWKYTKEYQWNILQVKRLEPPHLGLRASYHNGGAFFSVYPMKKPKLLDPTLYCLLRHPFTCFYVYFLPDSTKNEPYTTHGIYEVNRTEFLHLLKTWGVSLEK